MSAGLPLVTVGMAVYNGQEHIAESVRSILQQTYPNWELLAVDDGSSDRSLELLETLREPRIIVEINERNLGLVGVRNRILQMARGSYVAWLDQDDLAYPDRLAQQVAFLESRPEVSACGSWTDIIEHHPDGHESRRCLRLPRSHDEIRAQLPFRNPISCNTVMMRVDAFRQAGLAFRPPYGNSLDYDLWSIASDSLGFANMPSALGAYRVHAGQTSQGAALDIMNDHQVRIASELIERTLGIQMTQERRLLHRRATVWPVRLEDPADVTEIARWFAALRGANRTALAFDPGAFDHAIARQWLTVCQGARRGGLPLRQVVTAFRAGMRTIGLGIGGMAGAVAEAVRDRA